jgi:hypothetical protein
MEPQNTKHLEKSTRQLPYRVTLVSPSVLVPLTFTRLLAKKYTPLLSLTADAPIFNLPSFPLEQEHKML